MVLISFTVKRSPVKSNTISRFGNSPPNSDDCRQTVIHIIFLGPYIIVFVHERSKFRHFRFVRFNNTIKIIYHRDCNRISVIISKFTIWTKIIFHVTQVIFALNHSISKVIIDINRFTAIFSNNPIFISFIHVIKRSNPYFCRMLRSIIRSVMVIELHTTHKFIVCIQKFNGREKHLTDKITHFFFISNSRNITNNIIMFHCQL